MEAFPVANQTTNTIMNLLVNEVISRHGVCEELLTDRGSNFTSKDFKGLCADLGIKKVFTSTYHPQAVGQVERFNATICKMLSHYVNKDQKNWDLQLPLLLLAYRTAVHSTTKETPFFLMHGRDARLPQELLEKPRKTLYGYDYRAEITRRIQLAFETARENLAENALKQSQRSQIKRKLVVLKEGDWVMLFTP